MPAIRESFNRTVRPQGHVFYGWWMVAASSGIQVLGGALLQSATGAYIVLLGREFGWSKAALSAAFSLARLESGILGPVQGWMIDRFGPRAIMRIGILMFGIGFMAFSRIDSLPWYYATYFLMAIGSESRRLPLGHGRPRALVQPPSREGTRDLADRLLGRRADGAAGRVLPRGVRLA